MARNVGPEDRVVRILAGIGFIVLGYLQVAPPIACIVLYVLGAYLLITGIIVRCPFYKMIDVDTSIQEQPYSTTDDRAGF